MQRLKCRVIGLELESQLVRAVVLDEQGGVERFAQAPIEGSLAEACKSVLGEISDELVVSGLDTADLLIRQVKLDVAKEKDIEAVRDFQVEPLLPFPIEEAVVDHLVVERSKESATVMVMTILKSRLREHLESLKEGGVEPERTTCVPVALARLVDHLIPSSELRAVLHLGEESTSCVLLQGARVVATRSVGYGSRVLREGEVNFLTLEASEPVAQRAEAFRAELAKTFFALTQRKGEISQIFLTGAFEEHTHLDTYLGHLLDAPLTRLPEGGACALPIARYAVALGLALSGLPCKERVVDFRKGAFAYPHPWKRLRKQLIGFGLAASFVAVTLFGLGQVWLDRSQRAVEVAYGQLAALAGEPLLHLPAQELLDGAERLQAKLRTTPETFPLMPHVPLVGDVMAWVAHHPQVVDQIRIEGLSYRMVRHPTCKKPKERYGVRLDLDFRAESPTAARAFHDALLAGDSLIDPSSEVKWTVNRGLYRASFFLRDRTFYPEFSG